MTNGLAIAYYEWHQEITYDKTTYKFIKGKGIDHIRTVDRRLFKPKEWEEEALEFVRDNHLEDIYSQVLNYVKANHKWFKRKEEIVQHALDCLLHESYLHWEDFNIQETLQL